MMVISRTPLRISFAGGGTDLPKFYQDKGGLVLSSAINKYVYVIVKKRFDDLICLSWHKKEKVKNVDQIKHELIREAMKKTGVLSGVEITTISDIFSRGSGLGSSSAVTVGLLNALYAFTKKKVSSEQLAREACEIEIDILKKPIGKQDQYICAYGGFRETNFFKNEQISCQRFYLSEPGKKILNASLLLFNTGINRESALILKNQSSNNLSQIKNLVTPMKQAILSGDMRTVGEILNQNWVLKKEFSNGVSNEKIDRMYNQALKAGAYGGKITGAGGGGHLLLICPPLKKEAIIKALKGFTSLPVSLEPEGSKVVTLSL